MPRATDLLIARRARRAGAKWSLRIVLEARRAGIPVSLAFALVEQESDFANVFGHDPTIFVGAGEVSRSKYLAYKAQRGTRLMQGVGPCQLTWWQTQDAADRLGGCWKPAVNIRVALTMLAGLVHARGLRAGIAAYNGSGAAAHRYAEQVLARQAHWHHTLTRRSSR